MTTEEQASPRTGSKWQGATREQIFTILAVWCPNEEPDRWVKYHDAMNREYSCRLEAFLARFSETVD
jgi:hypothetical protein